MSKKIDSFVRNNSIVPEIAEAQQNKANPKFDTTHIFRMLKNNDG